MAESYQPLASAPAQPSSFLPPPKALVKCDGQDIVKRGHRKNKFLFLFPVLVVPTSGGQVGELQNLDSKNPVLYMHFPQGRLKLFGRIAYPKNKYLTLHLQKSAKQIICEDFFESLVVFSDVWWIGTKEDNPGEKQLDMPLDMQVVPPV